MEFGIFNSLHTPHQVYEAEADQWAVEAQRLRNEVAWTKAADRAGFKYTWATEHHFLTEYSHLSSNEGFLGYLAGVTERIHVGSGIEKYFPAKRYSVSRHIFLNSGRTSSTIAFVSSGSRIPKPRCSVDDDPRQTPNSKRPPER